MSDTALITDIGLNKITAAAGGASAVAITHVALGDGGGAAYEPRCLVPDFDGVLYSQEWKEALWDKFYTAAPRRQRQCVEQYNIVKRT